MVHDRVKEGKQSLKVAGGGAPWQQREGGVGSSSHASYRGREVVGACAAQLETGLAKKASTAGCCAETESMCAQCMFVILSVRTEEDEVVAGKDRSGEHVRWTNATFVELFILVLKRMVMAWEGLAILA